jgi:hypothetical protein
VRVLLTLVVISFLTGCGSETAATPLPTLPAGSLPELRSSTDAVSLDDLTSEFGSAAESEDDWGFARGSERVFQGESQRFDRVVSRTLEFDDTAGAHAYVAFFRSHLADVFGAGTSARPLDSGGRKGYLVDAASCACHRAEPTLAAVVARGDRVTYLEVNGGGAKPDAVLDLLTQAP